MKYEKSVITMTLPWLDFLVYSLGNCVDDTCTDTGLSISLSNVIGWVSRMVLVLCG